MKESRYLKRFEELKEKAPQSFQLVGDFVLVERIPEEELKTAGGIIVPTMYAEKQVTALMADRPNWVRVLLVGEGYYNDETGEDVPLDVKVGDIVLMSRVSIKYFSAFGELKGYEADSIGIARASEVQLKFFGEEEYKKAFEALNSSFVPKSDGTPS